jgi:hypothetical protein
MIVSTNVNVGIQCYETLIPEDARRPIQDSRKNVRTNEGPAMTYVVEVEENCEDCGGSGFDLGSLCAMEPEECRTCRGSGKQIVRRDYLAEALRIAGGMSHREPQREHLEAVIQHCRSLVAAAMVLPMRE